MVCKEEVITWFKDLDSYKRIDVLCELLNMLVPFELRFLGSCVEELGKHTYQELRTQASFANDIEKLSNDVMLKNQSLFEDTVRHRVLLNLSLLKSRNYCVANWYSKMFLRTDHVQDLIAKEHDDIVQSELLLLFTMASRHPAFSFEQRDFFSTILLQLCKLQKERLSNKAANTFGYPPGFGYPTVQQRKNMYEQPTIPPINFAMHHPPGIPNPHIEYMTPLRNWPGISCGAPEVFLWHPAPTNVLPQVPPFSQPLHPPHPPTSPLVSHGGSPTQSRSSSPHGAGTRPPPVPLLPPHANPPIVPTMELVTVPAMVAASTVGGAMHEPVPPPPVSLPLVQSSQQFAHETVPSAMRDTDMPETKVSSGLMEEHKVQQSWMQSQANEMKPPNGVRFPFPGVSKLRPSLNEQIHTMSLNDNDNVPYHSNSSSNSSPRVSPPSTPSVAELQGPGRGPPMVNGGPQAFPPLPFAPDAIPGGSPPPQMPPGTVGPPPLSACTVPYTYPSFTTIPPNRPMFATFRPTFATHYAFPAPSGAGESGSFPAYNLPYFSLMYSSYPHPLAPQPPAAAGPAVAPVSRPPSGCYNCGSATHVGDACGKQTIEDLIQKKAYGLTYSDTSSPDRPITE